VRVSVKPVARDVLGAVTAIDFNAAVAVVTVSAKALDAIPFSDAVMLLEPDATPVARPVLLTVTLGLLDVHVTELVRFCVLPSLNVPIAVNWSVLPARIEALGALMLIDCSRSGALKLTVVDPYIVTVWLGGWKLTPLC
jgi:hypothetical protein